MGNFGAEWSDVDNGRTEAGDGGKPQEHQGDGNGYGDARDAETQCAPQDRNFVLNMLKQFNEMTGSLWPGAADKMQKSVGQMEESERTEL